MDDIFPSCPVEIMITKRDRHFEGKSVHCVRGAQAPPFLPASDRGGPVADLGETLSLLHLEGGASTLMETELQDIRLAVYPRIKVLFQPTDRTKPSIVFTWTSQKLSPSSSRANSPRPWLTRLWS